MSLKPSRNVQQEQVLKLLLQHNKKTLKSQWIVEVTKKSPDESGAYIKINFKIRKIFLVAARKTSWINFFSSLFFSFLFYIQNPKKKKKYFFYSLKLDVVKITWRLFLGTSTLAESRRETKIYFLLRIWNRATHSKNERKKVSVPLSVDSDYEVCHVRDSKWNISKRSIKKFFFVTSNNWNSYFWTHSLSRPAVQMHEKIERCRHESMIWESHEERNQKKLRA